MRRNINNTKFVNIEAGLYDDTMKCPYCKFHYENRVDSSHDENLKNSDHDCTLYER